MSISNSSKEIRQVIRDLETCASKRRCQLILAKSALELKQEDLEKLQAELHQHKLDYALNPDPDIFKIEIKPREKGLEILTREIEGLKLKVEALENLVASDEDLDSFHKDLAEAEAAELAAQMPKLLDEYNTHIYNAFTAMQKIKILRQGVFERDKEALKKVVGERIYSLIQAIPPSLVLAEWSKGGHSLIALNFDASQKDRIVTEMLGK